MYIVLFKILHLISSFWTTHHADIINSVHGCIIHITCYVGLEDKHTQSDNTKHSLFMVNVTHHQTTTKELEPYRQSQNVCIHNKFQDSEMEATTVYGKQEARSKKQTVPTTLYKRRMSNMRKKRKWLQGHKWSHHINGGEEAVWPRETTVLGQAWDNVLEVLPQTQYAAISPFAHGRLSDVDPNHRYPKSLRNMGLGCMLTIASRSQTASSLHFLQTGVIGRDVSL